MILDYNLIWENLPLYFSGALVTLKVLLISLFFGLMLAIPLALMRVSRSHLIFFFFCLYTLFIIFSSFSLFLK